jgi:hypothetical protein
MSATYLGAFQHLERVTATYLAAAGSNFPRHSCVYLGGRRALSLPAALPLRGAVSPVVLAFIWVAGVQPFFDVTHDKIL